MLTQIQQKSSNLFPLILLNDSFDLDSKVMNYDEAVKYLYGLGNEVLAMKLGLENILKLLKALGNPEKNYLKVQIAGTNGKGSTVAFLESICVNAKIKTGATTSPHLISVTERVRINGEEISEKDFARIATIIRKTSENLVELGELETVPTYFEQVTAIALFAFAEAKVELAILETGLGGRFDATTAANAEIVGITPIDLDHQRILGETLAEIAAEKAAIIRANTKVIIGKQKSQAENVILERIKKIGISPEPKCIWIEENSNEIFYKTKNGFYLGYLGLEGEHQRDNACIAIQLAEVLANDFGFKISEVEIEKGLKTAKHKGRLELYKGILFDGAHNVAGAKALQNYLHKYYSDAKILMVFGTMKDKEVSRIAKILFPLAEDLILTEPRNARTMSVKNLEQIALKYIDKDKIYIVPDVFDAIDSGKQISINYPKTQRSLILVTGSLYLIGEAQKILSETSKF